MINKIKESVWRQFGASIDMLENVIVMSPEDFMHENKHFFYIIFHNLIFLDYYMTLPPEDFKSKLPFTIKDANEIPKEAIDDLIPDSYYDKSELLEYLRQSRTKCFKMIHDLTEHKLNVRFTEDLDTDAMDYPILEILLYNMRHVQHHTGQLNLLLRQNLHHSPKWVFRAKDEL
jgi:hypothetical protein